MFDYILLEAYCSFDGEKTDEEKLCPPSCNRQRIPEFSCIANECPYFSYTTAEYALAYFGKESSSKHEILLGEESDVELWESICRRKIDEAWEEYIKIHPEENTTLGHYQNDANFIDDTATVIHIFYAEYSHRIVIVFSGLCEAYQDNRFEISINSADSELKSKILNNIKPGDAVRFISDPWCCTPECFMPIVAIWSADGEPLLKYEEGYANLMESLKRQYGNES